MKKIFKKFKFKILLSFLFISLIPLLITSVSNLFVMIESREENIKEIENLAIESVSEKITKFLNQKIENLNLVINTNPSNISEIDQANLNFLIDSIRTTAGGINKITFIDKYGQEISKRPQDVTELISVTDQPIFWKALEDKKVFGPLVKKEGKVAMVMASQIENSNRELIGVILAEVDLSPVMEMINETKLSSQRYLSVLDKNGYIIFKPEAVNLEDTAYFTNIKEIKNLIGNAGQNSDFLTYKNRNGEEVVIGGKSLKTTDWFILSQWPQDDAFKIIDHILKESLIIFLITLFFILILSFYAARKIDEPIKILSMGAREIALGNLDHKIELRTNDEFEVLGEKFNNMISVLKENKKLKDEFVFIAAHELRTPVTAIKGYISMILEGSFGEVPEKIKNNLTIVFNSNERLMQLVHDLLEIARSDNGKMSIDLSPVSMKESIDLVISELSPIALKKHINIRYAGDQNDMVRADGYKLKEVLTNLIGNAIKYTLTDGDIEISHEIDDKFLTTHIKDHGIGMADEELTKLFTKFYRIKTEETKKIEGTGLGLFICKEIISRMGGEIRAKSEAGKGSTFSFKLPLA